MQEVAEDHVRCLRSGRLSVVLLDRPRALNALNLVMIEALSRIVRELAADADVDAIVLRGSSERAFCAGGDMRAIGTRPTREERMALGRAFFATEYRLNLFIHDCGKPVISLIDGIAMGGGIGLSVFGSHRVVSERARLAMPEVALGFFPDVGGAWFLNRCPGATGRYLALTGTTIGAADAIFSGLATHHVPAERFDAVVEALSSQSAITHGTIDALLDELGADAGSSDLLDRHAQINDIFGGDTLEGVIARVNDRAASTADWVLAASQALAKASPTSLRATWRRMSTAAACDPSQILAQDFRMAIRMVASDEFVEGVRAVLVDKDQAPRWRPGAIRDVSDSLIDEMLMPLADEPSLTT